MNLITLHVTCSALLPKVTYMHLIQWAIPTGAIWGEVSFPSTQRHGDWTSNPLDLKTSALTHWATHSSCDLSSLVLSRQLNWMYRGFHLHSIWHPVCARCNRQVLHCYVRRWLLHAPSSSGDHTFLSVSQIWPRDSHCVCCFSHFCINKEWFSLSSFLRLNHSLLFIQVKSKVKAFYCHCTKNTTRFRVQPCPSVHKLGANWVFSYGAFSDHANCYTLNSNPLYQIVISSTFLLLQLTFWIILSFNENVQINRKKRILLL